MPIAGTRSAEPPAETPAPTNLARQAPGTADVPPAGSQVTYCHPPAIPDPPFGTPRTMTVRLVADIQNRLFWLVGTGRASECVRSPLRDWRGRLPEIGDDVPASAAPAGL